MQKNSGSFPFVVQRILLAGSGREFLMQKIYLVYVWCAEIGEAVLHEVCGNPDAVEQSKAELLKEGYAEKHIDVQEASVRN